MLSGRPMNSVVKAPRAKLASLGRPLALLLSPLLPSLALADTACLDLAEAWKSAQSEHWKVLKREVSVRAGADGVEITPSKVARTRITGQLKVAQDHCRTLALLSPAKSRRFKGFFGFPSPIVASSSDALLVQGKPFGPSSVVSGFRVKASSEGHELHTVQFKVSGALRTDDARVVAALMDALEGRGGKGLSLD